VGFFLPLSKSLLKNVPSVGKKTMIYEVVQRYKNVGCFAPNASAVATILKHVIKDTLFQLQ